MNQTWKIFIAVLVTAVIVGGGVYFWQKNVQNSQVAPQPQSQQIEQANKTFEGAGFTFSYPAKYASNVRGLWTPEEFARYNDPSKWGDVKPLPEVEIKSVTTGNTAEQQVLSDNSLPGKTLEEMSKQTKIPYENIKIGENNFVKITVSDMYDVTNYYTKQNGTVVGFRVYFTAKDNQELRDIIASLKFTEDKKEPPYQISFDGCGKLDQYKTKSWYAELEKRAQNGNFVKEPVRGVANYPIEKATLKDVNDACFSENGDLLVMLIPGEYAQGPTIYRFDTVSPYNLEKATYSNKMRNWLASPDEFGKRVGDVIEMIGKSGDAGFGTDMYFEYNFKTNVIELKKEYNYSADEPDKGTWKNY
ncbi:MAG: hypothetical protein US89_C0007G0030 [Candidatus Peregrinibacteria bacterium GW2011_GWF2_38_29]|nr:MAG: hypothetical protein US89_C0007G0030 [Candidatus Peregrinibacteria bacterium GW2011_GWF2_38_29]HBB02847.1 hypothetical protein [Candidatus Peregrinibacteria bacterium]